MEEKWQEKSKQMVNQCEKKWERKYGDLVEDSETLKKKLSENEEKVRGFFKSLPFLCSEIGICCV